MKNIKFAEASDIPEIRALWDIAFGSEKDFNDCFFSNFFDPQKALIFTIDGKIAAMTQMLDYNIPSFGDVTYIYGAVTHPNYRKKGIMSQLLEESFDIDKKNNRSGSVLIPATAGLFDFYARLGYKKAFYIKKTVYKAHTEDIYPVCTDDTAFLNSIYEKSLRDLPHPVRTPDYWAQQIKMFNTLGGFVFKTDTAYAFGYPDGIQELMGTNKGSLASGIAKKLHLFEISATEAGTDTPFGMLKPYNKSFENMYFNLMFN